MPINWDSGSYNYQITYNGTTVISMPNPYERIFGKLWLETKDSVPFSGNQHPCNGIMSELMEMSSDFKSLVKNSFGFDSPKILKMVGEKTVVTRETQEYEYGDLPNSKASEAQWQIATADSSGAMAVSNPEAYEAPQTTGRLVVDGNVTADAVQWYKSYITSTSSTNFINLVVKKKEYKIINDGIFLKGFLVKDLLNVDYMYQLLELDNDPYGTLSFSHEERMAIREFLSNLHPSKIVRLIGPLSSSSSLIDTVRQYRWYKEKGCVIPAHWKDLNELHDDISRQVRDIKAMEASRDISYTELVKSLNGLKVHDDISLMVPPNTATLVKWGSELNNCLSSYDKKVLKDNSLIVGVIKKDKLTYAIEIRREKIPGVLEGTDSKLAVPPMIKLDIAQFYGYSNSKPEQEDETMVKGVLGAFINELKGGPFVTEIRSGLEDLY